jgi:hypothetical protein
MQILHPSHSPTGGLAAASELFALVPSCLMTLAPVTPPTEIRLTRANVEDVLTQCAARFVLVLEADITRQLASAHSDLKGHVEFAYVGVIEKNAPFGIAGHDFAFVSVLGFEDDATAARAGERMAWHPRTSTSGRGFVCANVIVQRIVADGMNPDKLDRFLLERFGSAATRDLAI